MDRLEEPPAPLTDPCERLRTDWLGLLHDPDWWSFVAVLLVPAAGCLALGGLQQASFFAGTAIYLGTLKWLGRVVVTSRVTGVPGYLLFPADLFAGLALVCAWFYFRAMLNLVWPSFPLRELTLVPYLVGLAQLLGLALRRPPGFRTRCLHGLLACSPFVLLLTVALWHVSGCLHVQSSDPLIHAWIARLYREGGIRVHPLADGGLLGYPSGFGALNVLTMSLSPLDVVQAVNLQHILWLSAGLFLIPTTVAAVGKTQSLFLFVLPLGLVALFPIYALELANFYEGTPRQTVPGLLAAACLLPAVSGRSFAALIASVSASNVLAVLALAMNPAAAPFAGLAWLTATIIFWTRLRQIHRGWYVLGALPLVAAAAVLLLGRDPYWSPSVRQEEGKKSGVRNDTPLTFSAAAGWREVTRINLFEPSASVRIDVRPSTEDHTLRYRLDGWTNTILTLMITILALISVVLARRRPTSLVWFSAFYLLFWLLIRPALVFLAGGLPTARHDTSLLRVYLIFLLLRFEILILFAAFAASCAHLIPLVLHSSRWGAYGRVLAIQLFLVPVGLLFAVLLTSGGRGGHLVTPLTLNWRVGTDDYRLLEWYEKNLSPERGGIGLQAYSFIGGPDSSEKHLYPLGGANVFVLYGIKSHYHFFGPAEVEGIYDEYLAHVRDNLDVEWCFRRGIRFFYLTTDFFSYNPGLANAVRDGRLRPVKRFGVSGIYEVVAGP